MDKCNICGTEQKQIGTHTFSFMGMENIKSIESPHYNIQLMTEIKGKQICTKCMDTYYKIDALMREMDFSCGGTHYYADGRNLD